MGWTIVVKSIREIMVVVVDLVQQEMGNFVDKIVKCGVN